MVRAGCEAKSALGKQAAVSLTKVHRLTSLMAAACTGLMGHVHSGSCLPGCCPAGGRPGNSWRLLGRSQGRVDNSLHRRKVQQGRQRDKGVEQLVVAKHLQGDGSIGLHGGRDGAAQTAPRAQGESSAAAHGTCRGHREEAQCGSSGPVATASGSRAAPDRVASEHRRAPAAGSQGIFMRCAREEQAAAALQHAARISWCRPTAHGGAFCSGAGKHQRQLALPPACTSSSLHRRQLTPSE